MGRYTGPSCRQCRREGTKLFLKGTKCFTEKCPVERRPYAPGQHGQAPRAAARRRSTRSSCARSRRSSASTACQRAAVPQHVRAGRRRCRASRATTFSRRSRAGWTTWSTAWASREPQGGAPAHPAPPRRGERQDGRHPELSSCSRARKCASAQKSREIGRSSRPRWISASRGAPLSWLAVDRDTFSGRMLERPQRPNIPIAAQEQLVVELYSK